VVQSSTQYGTRRFVVIFENCCLENGERLLRQETSVKRTTLSTSLAKLLE
jgi:hypothetical protein